MTEVDVTFGESESEVKQVISGDYTIKEIIDGLLFMAAVFGAVLKNPEGELFEITDFEGPHGTDLRKLAKFAQAYSYVWDDAETGDCCEGKFCTGFYNRQDRQGKSVWHKYIKVYSDDFTKRFFRGECTLREMITA